VTAVGIVGSGRAGAGLAFALTQARATVRLHGRRRKKLPPGVEATFGGPPPWLSEVNVVLLAVPDRAIREVADELAETWQVNAKHVVLHLSGVLDHTALTALEGTGAALGSMHPLQTVSDPLTAPERLRGAAAAIEGEERAVDAATRIARLVGMQPIRVPAEGKARYHAAAVFASNYVVVLAAVARRLLRQTGVSAESSWTAIGPLMEGTLGNMWSGGPEQALTGPVVRGDVDTIRRNLQALTGEDAALYRALGLAAARMAPLEPAKRALVEEALTAES